MAIEIKKPIDRALLKDIIRDFDLYALWDTLKDQTIIDVDEDYTRCLAADPGALLVIDDTSTTPGTGEVGLSVVLPFILDITAGEYVLHTDEQSHIGTMRLRKYALREDVGMTEEEIEKMWDASAKDTTAYKNLIQDNTISSITLWSSQKTNDKIQGMLSTAEAYADELMGKHITISLEFVTALPTVGSFSVLYILDNGTSYPIYIYSSTKGWVLTGADLSSIKLDDYYKKTEIDTKLDDYVKTSSIVNITTETSTTTVMSSKAVDDNYINKDKIVTDLTTGTLDDTQVVSAKEAKEYIDNKIVYSSTEPTDAQEGSEWTSPY